MNETALPNYRRPELKAVDKDLTLVVDLLGGTPTMRAKATTYIKKWPDEDERVYEFRRDIETVFEGLGRTLSAATGMLFSKPPGLTWNKSEAAMSEQYSNLDAAGTAGPVLIKRFGEAAMRDGVGGILIDHPPPPKDVVTINKQMETDLGLRPTWALYGRAQIINWRTALVENRRLFTMLVLHETAEVDDGAYGIKPVHRFRVLRLLLTPDGWQATWKLWESDKADATRIDDFRDAGGGVFRNRLGDVASFLPFSIAYTGRTDAPMTATIPLLGVAWANLAHWQQSSELRFYRALSGFPQPVVTGQLANDAITGKPGKLRISPMVAVHLSDAAATFKWEELKGTSMDQLEKGIQEKLRHMSMLGMAFLMEQKRVPETAEAKRLDATAENSTLATAAQGIEDACNSALEHHAWYLGIAKADAPVLSINRDYEATMIDAQTMLAYVAACKDAGLPPRVLAEAWQAGGRLSPDTDIDALAAEMEAASAAAAANAASTAQDSKTLLPIAA